MMSSSFRPRRMRAWALLVATLPGIATATSPSVGLGADAFLRAVVAGRDTTAQAAALRAAAPAASALAPTKFVETPMQRFDLALRAARVALASGQADAIAAARLRLEAADALVSAEFDRLAEFEPGRTPVDLQPRVDAARKRWREAADPVLAALAAVAQAAGAERATHTRDALRLLDASTRDAIPVFGAQSLPQHRPSLLPRAPRLQPDSPPSYAANGAEVQPLPADLAAGADAALSPAVLAQAASLGHDYIAISDFVRTQVRTQWYAGAQKGADETLATRAGNDVDQASLLIALLRASKAPARYVTGVVQVPVADLASQLGVAESQAGPALAAAGVAHFPVIAQGRVTAFRLEQVWVAAFVPYGNYRGSAADSAARSWIPLMPALKPASFTPAQPVLAPAGLQAKPWIDEFLAAPRSELPWSALRGELTRRLAGLQPALDLEARGARHANAAAPLSLLPSSTPYPVLAVNLEAAELLDEQRQWLQLVMRSGTSATDSVVLQARWPLSQLATRRMALGYVPATVEDQHLANARGGLGAVPAYLLRVRPSVWIDGRPATAGTGTLDLGAAHRIELELSGPAGSVTAAQDLRAGGIAALALDPQGDRLLPAEVDVPPAAGTADRSDPAAARALGYFAQRYQAEWSDADVQIGAALGATVMRPLPSATLAIAQYRVDEVLGLAHQLRFEGVALDALLRPVEPIAQRADGSIERDWMDVSALHGSALEHELFQRLWGVDAVSADKGLQTAAGRGVPRLALAPGADAQALLAAHESSVRSHVQSWLDRGLDVEIPRDPLTLAAWTGSAWRARNPATGETGYFVAGRYAGGVTVIPPNLWLVPDLASLFANPYGGFPNKDPLAGFLIQLDASAQGQTGTVGEPLAQPLAAVVSDEVGRPVQGAEVTFTVFEGGANFDGAVTIKVATDARGVALAHLTMPQRQQGLGRYFHTEGAAFPQWGSTNSVDVRVSTATGDLISESPYWAYAVPGAAVRVAFVNVPADYRPAPGLMFFALGIETYDAYDNRVFGQDVNVSVNDQLPTPGCVGHDIESAPRSGLFLPGTCPADAVRYVGLPCVSNSVTITTRPETAIANLAPTAAMMTKINLAASGAAGSASLQLTTDGEIRKESDSDLCQTWFYASVAQSVYTLRDGIGLHGVGVRSMEAARINTAFPVTRQVRAAFATGRSWLGWGGAPPPAGTTISASGAQVLGPRTGGGGLEYDLMAGGAATQVSGSLTMPLPPPFDEPLITAIPPAWVLDLPPPIMAPERLEVSAFQRSLSDLSLTAGFGPASYIARNGTMELLADGEVDGSCTQVHIGGDYRCRFGVGRAFDPEKRYSARYSINSGTPFYLQSGEAEVELSRGIIAGFGADNTAAPLPELGSFIARRYPRRLKMQHEIDVPTQFQCPDSVRFVYAVGQPATVSLRFFDLNEDGERGFVAWEPIVAQARAEGVFSLDIDTGDLPFGEYEYELRAVAQSDGKEEVFTGRASNIAQRRDSLPLAHSFVKGVDLFSGHAVISAEDVAVGGRGPGMKFTRTYSSHSGNEPTWLGRGWNSDLDAQVSLDRCGTYTVTGAAGQGQRFVRDGTLADGSPSFRALHGYNGTLVRRNGGWFDFYSKNGTRYHFAEPGGAGPRLSFIEDPNGNRVTYEYDRDTYPPQVSRMRDGAGRTLEMDYDTVVLSEGETDSGFQVRSTRHLLVSVRGPLGLSVKYEYDADGNLVKATHKQGEAPGPRRESYAYEDRGGAWTVEPGGEFKYHHFGFRLVRARNDIDGGERDYGYQLGWSGVQTDDGPLFIPEQRVVTVTEPDEGLTGLQYVGVRGLGAVGTVVTDARLAETKYALNGYGAAERVEDPAGVTQTTWDLVAMQPASVRDAIGTVTAYRYGLFANKEEESVTREGVTHTRRWIYHPPTLFATPIKDRVKDYTDGRGIVTRTSWDERGNLLGTSRGGVEESFTFNEKGDRTTRTDGNGDITTFGYDAYGHLVTEIDSLGSRRSAAFDALDRKTWERDGKNNQTDFEYDAQGRLLLTRHPAAPQGLDGPTTRAERTVEYRDNERVRIETDENRHATRYTHDAMGRVLQERNADGGVRTFTYDHNGNKESETNFRNQVTRFEYDAANRMERRIEPLGRITEFDHDALGHVLRETTGARVTEFEYAHPAYLRTKVRRKLGTEWIETLEAYDENGNNTLSTDARGKTTTRVFDARDRLDLVQEPEGRQTDPAYDDADRKIEETLSGPNQVPQLRRWSHDQRGRERSRTDAEGQAWLTDYDLSDNPVRRADPLGHAVTLGYDARNRVVSESGPVPGRETRYGYDGGVNRTDERHANGRQVRHEFDLLDRHVASRDLAGDFTRPEFQRFGYDADGNRTSIVDGNGNATTFEVDALNRVFAEHRPLSRTLRWTHTVHGEIQTETDAEGNTTTHEIDALGRRTKTTSPAPFAYTTTFGLDANGNVVTQTNARDLTTTFEYDGLNRKVRQIDPAPLGYEQTWTYDAAGNVVAQTDRRGIATRFGYDRENRLAKRWRGNVLLETRRYDVAGNLEVATDARGNETRHEYNAANEPTRLLRPEGVEEKTEYFAWGDVRRRVDADGVASDYTYDLRRRLVSETRPHPEAPAVTTHEYDGQGNKTATIRPLGAQYRWVFGYDAAMRLASIDSPVGAHTSYGYDKADRRTAVLDARDHETETAYDELGRPTRIDFADDTFETIDEYDGNGNVLRRTDANGRQVTHTYDELDRLVERDFGGDAAPRDIVGERTTFDPDGHPTLLVQEEAGGSTHQTQRVWNEQDRLARETDRWAIATEFEYDPQGNRVARTDPEGRTQTQPDRLDRVRTVTPPGEAAMALDYTPGGRIKLQTHPNGATAAFDYDAAGRLARITHRQAGNTVASFEYAYDRNGNRVQEIQVTAAGTRTTTYRYDRDDRLVGFAVTGEDSIVTDTTYTLDDVGNRATEAVVRGGTLVANRTYTYSARDQVEQVSDSVAGVTTTYEYDDNGNLTEESTGAQVTTYRINPQDRVATLTAPTGPPVDYAYDVDGRRVEKRTTAEAVRYGWDGEHLRRETNVANNPLATYDWHAGRVLRTHRTGLTSYAQHDALKSPIRWSRADGGEQGRASYDAWGNATAQTGTLPPIGFTGYYADAESSLYYAQQRYYSPKLGRFTRIDPWAGDVLNPITLNKYLYGNGNPLIFIDPSGEISLLSDPDEDITQFTDESLAVAKDFGSRIGEASWSDKPGLAAGWLLAGGAYISGNVVNGLRGMTNATANAIVVAGDTALGGNSVLSPLAGEARNEVGAFVEAAAPFIDAFRADWRGTSGKVMTAAGAGIATTVRGVLAGETQAVLDTVSNLNPRKAADSLGSTMRRAVDGPPVGAPRASVVTEGAGGQAAVRPGRPLTEQRSNLDARTPPAPMLLLGRDARTRLPQDARVNSVAPQALPIAGRRVGTSASQHAQLQADIADAQSAGARDFRVNQQQVNSRGERVGTNRPDLQYTRSDGTRVYIEYDRTTPGTFPNTPRGPEHMGRTLANDPDGVSILRTGN